MKPRQDFDPIEVTKIITAAFAHGCLHGVRIDGCDKSACQPSGKLLDG
jgi:hypothetical protein